MRKLIFGRYHFYLGWARTRWHTTIQVCRRDHYFSIHREYMREHKLYILGIIIGRLNIQIMRR